MNKHLRKQEQGNQDQAMITVKGKLSGYGMRITRSAQRWGEPITGGRL